MFKSFYGQQDFRCVFFSIETKSSEKKTSRSTQFGIVMFWFIDCNNHGFGIIISALIKISKIKKRQRLRALFRYPCKRSNVCFHNLCTSRRRRRLRRSFFFAKNSFKLMIHIIMSIIINICVLSNSISSTGNTETNKNGTKELQQNTKRARKKNRCSWRLILIAYQENCEPSKMKWKRSVDHRSWAA